jgi:hypothetical protein
MTGGKRGKRSTGAMIQPSTFFHGDFLENNFIFVLLCLKGFSYFSHSNHKKEIIHHTQSTNGKTVRDS